MEGRSTGSLQNTDSMHHPDTVKSGRHHNCQGRQDNYNNFPAPADKTYKTPLLPPATVCGWAPPALPFHLFFLLKTTDPDLANAQKTLDSSDPPDFPYLICYS